MRHGIEPLSERRLPVRLLFLVCVAGFAVRLPLLGLPLTYATDGWRQADTASIAYHFLHNGFRILFPQIFWGGTGPGFVETEFQLYPFLVALLYLPAGEHLWIGQVVSLLFSLGTWIVFAGLAGRMLDRPGAMAALIVVVFAPISLRYSVAFMPEATVFFFSLGAVAAFGVYIERGKTAFLWGASALMAIAILVKPTSILYLMIMGLFALVPQRRPALRDRRLWFAGVCSIVPAVFWYVHARELYLTYGNTFGLLSGGDSKFGSWEMWASPQFYVDLLRLDTVWVFAGLPLGLFLIGLVASLRRRTIPLVPIGAITVLLYYMIVGRYARQEWGIQYHIFFLPFAALGVGLGFQEARKWLASVRARRWSMVALLGGTSVVVGFGYFTMITFPGHRSTDQLVRLGVEVAANTRPSDRIVVTSSSISHDGPVPNNYQEPIVFFYARRYGWSIPPDRLSPARLDSLRLQGATHFVFHDRTAIGPDSLLASYLHATADSLPLSPGISGALFRWRREPGS